MDSSIKIIFLFIFLLCGNESIAQPKITAKIYPSEIKVNELSTLQFTIENFSNSKYFKLPDLKGLEIVSGPEYSSGPISNRDNNKKVVSISFIVRGNKPGVYKILNASCEADGKTLKCKPLTLVVKHNRDFKLRSGDDHESDDQDVLQDQYLKAGENAETKIKEGMHLRLSVSKKSCYVGEPVVATYKLYSRLNSDCRLVQNPSFNGFSVIDLQAPDVTEKYFEEYKGQKYAVYVIRKSQLYPLIDGRIEVEPASIEGEVDLIKIPSNNERDIFDDLFFREIVKRKINLKTDSTIINVKALPKGKPEGFAGAVGNFSIQSRLEENVFNAKKGGKLILSISGNGNFQMINSPYIRWPEGFEAFEPQTAESLDKSSVPINGRKDFECEFNTALAGNYTIPKISFSFFDPELKTYKTVSTDPIPFKVIPASNEKVQNSELNFETLENTNASKSPVYLNKYVLGSGGALVFGLLFFMMYKKNRKSKKGVFVKEEEYDEYWNKIIEARSVHPLVESENCIKQNDCSKFYFILNNEFKSFLSYKFDVDANKISGAFVKDRMDKNNICNSTMISVEQLINEIELRCYTPFVKDEQMEAILLRTQEMIQMINTYDCGKV